MRHSALFVAHKWRRYILQQAPTGCVWIACRGDVSGGLDASAQRFYPSGLLTAGVSKRAPRRCGDDGSCRSSATIGNPQGQVAQLVEQRTENPLLSQRASEEGDLAGGDDPGRTGVDGCEPRIRSHCRGRNRRRGSQPRSGALRSSAFSAEPLTVKCVAADAAVISQFVQFLLPRQGGGRRHAKRL